MDDPAQAIALVEATLDRYGRLDALVCNAGVMPEGPFGTADLNELRRVVDVNVRGAVYPLEPAWRHMLATEYSRVVLTGSAVGMYGHGSTAVYGATKSATVGLARSLANETL